MKFPPRGWGVPAVWTSAGTDDADTRRGSVRKGFGDEREPEADAEAGARKRRMWLGQADRPW